MPGTNHHAVQMVNGPETDRLILPRSVDASGERSAESRGARPTGGSSGSRNPAWADVPWRTIVSVVGVVLATYIVLILVLATVRIIAWVVVAGFFAIVLAPLVRRVQARVGDRRTVATSIVVISTLAAMVGVITLFILPVRSQLVNVLTDLPGTVRDAARGRGPIGNLVKKLHIESYVQHNEVKLAKAATKLNDYSVETATTAISVVLAFITITLITFLFLSQSEAMGRAVMNVMPHRRRASVRRIAVEAAGAVSGYVIGNLLVSLVAGVAAFICLVSVRVPSPVVLALFVAFADLIPLVGATLGAAISVLAAFLYSPTAGLVSLIFFIIYQQVENGLIYPWIMARKVNVNPLVILLSVLVGVELFGIVGALLAVPASGALQVIIKAVRQEHGREQLVLPDNISEPVEMKTR